MARPSNRRQREVARQRARLAAEARQASTRRRQRLVAGAVAAVVVLGVVGAVLGSRTGGGSPATTTSTTSSVPTPGPSTSLPAAGVAPTPVAMGASLTGPTPCPAEDGSSPRTTLFAQAPPTCIDTTSFHIATITTSVGVMTVQLNPQLAPTTVNDVVVLARYHYYDGQPVTSVTARQSFTVGVALSGAGAERAPGFPFPDEAPPGGSVFSPGMLAVPAGSTTSGPGGQLLVATYEGAAGIDPGVTVVGIMLSGDEVLRAVDARASETGLPTEPVTITSVSVARSSPIPR